LRVIASLDSSDEEFTVQQIVEQSARMKMDPFRSSRVNQMLAKLAESGLVYKNRHGRYSFAVPLLGRFIRRQIASENA
jgi:DNA-binding IclR family transcriptional regulator